MEYKMDLNELSAEEVVALAYELQEEMQKEASEQDEQLDLNNLSPEEIVELGYYLADDMQKEASAEDFDLNELSAEEIVALGYEIAEDMTKEASEQDEEYLDLNELTPEEFLMLAAELEEDMDKEAGAFDINELSVDEFLHFAADLEEEMDKEAMSREAIMEMLRKGGRGAMDIATGKQAMEGLRKFRGRKKPSEVHGAARTSLKDARSRDMKNVRRGAAKTGLFYGAPTAATAYTYNRRKKKKSRK